MSQIGIFWTLTEVLEELVHQVLGFVLGVQELEHVMGALVGEVRR
jgi:hypothetical protein